MSQFDFPRINFFGSATINPATANNNSFYPLVLFDPTNVRAVMPPRIYLSDQIIKLHAVGLLPLPSGCPIFKDENLSSYIEIYTINSDKLFKQWATTRLGECKLDEPFHLFYNQIRTVRENKCLKGLIPANWNYYGGMEFRFDGVTVSSIEIAENSQRFFYTKEMVNCPADIDEILDASITLGNDEKNHHAVMIDVIPNLALYTQVFCDSFTINKFGRKIFSGRPGKASLRFLNLNRIVNQEGVIASSGTFFCVISMNPAIRKSYLPFLSFFKKYAFKRTPVAGLFIKYNLCEVRENQNPRYNSNTILSNPARCSVAGSITPWFRGEMRSIPMGRQLKAENSYALNQQLPPTICCFDKKRKVFCLDLIGSIPEIVNETASKSDYQTYDLGELKIRCLLEGKPVKEIGRIQVTEDDLPRKRFVTTGGIIEIPYSVDRNFNNHFIDNCSVLIYGKKRLNSEEDSILMRECEYMVATDQTGLYLNQHDNPDKGYISNSKLKEDCKITIYHKGKPLQNSVLMKILELRLNTAGPVPDVKVFQEDKDFKNNDTLKFPADKPGSAIYILFPGSLSASKDLLQDIIHTGFFINVRVLPRHDYGKYLNADHPDFPTQVTFDVIHQEILQVFSLIYPLSSIITPFTEENFKRGWKFIKQRLSPDNWDSQSYMPPSREMSDDQWLLISKWEQGAIE